MAAIDFEAFDADNHYYEATDAFTRHLPPERPRFVQWAEINGKQRMVVDNKVNRFIPNPTFDPVARAGRASTSTSAASVPATTSATRSASSSRSTRRTASPTRASRSWTSRASRAASCSRRSASAWRRRCCTIPTALHDVFHAFNQWMHDDWTFDYEDRIFAAPYICCWIRSAAEQEVEWALDHGAHVVVMRSGPVRGPGFARSPGDPVYDPSGRASPRPGSSSRTTRATRATTATPTSGATGGDFEAFRNDPFRSVTGGHRPIYDTMAALVCHGVFTRHPNLRVATIESGSDWVPLLLHALKKSYGQAPTAFGGGDPAQQLRDHVWVSPYYEDDLPQLRDELGADRIIFGSDYPHAEGLADPLAFVKDLDGFSDDEIRLVMRENALELSVPRKSRSRPASTPG